MLGPQLSREREREGWRGNCASFGAVVRMKGEDACECAVAVQAMIF